MIENDVPASMIADVREVKLPGWARETLASLRAMVRTAEAVAREARQAAEAATGKLDTTDAAITVNLPDDQAIGLPEGATVDFRVLNATVSVEDDGLLVDCLGDVAIVPVTSEQVRIVSAPAGAGRRR